MNYEQLQVKMSNGPPPHIKSSHMIFIGGIPHDMTVEQFNEEVDKWPGIVRRHFRNPGWAIATFRSAHDRDTFLKNENKHKLGNKVVDVKAYQWQNRNQEAQQHPLNEMQRAVPQGLGTFTHTASQQPVRPVGADFLNPAVVNCQTGTISRYISPFLGHVKTSNHGVGMFHADVVYLCSKHGVTCKLANCLYYKRFNSKSIQAKSMYELLPMGTQINFLKRSIVSASEVAFQATMVWPQQSKKPSSVEKSLDIELEEHFRLHETLEGIRHLEPSQSKPPASLVVGAGRPEMKIENLTSSSARLNDDNDFDLGEIDGCMDKMGAIRSFSKQALSALHDKSRISCMALENRLMAIRDEQEGLGAIYDCLTNNNIIFDETKRAHIAANYKTLLHTILRGKQFQTSPLAERPFAQNAPFQPVAQHNPVETQRRNEFYREENRIYYDGIEMDERFESFLFDILKVQEFKNRKSDEFIRGQCKAFTELLRDINFPVYILANEYENSITKLETDARSALRKVWERRFDCGTKITSKVALESGNFLDLVWRFFSEAKFYECNLEVQHQIRISSKNYLEFASDVSKPLPPFGYIEKALALLKSKAFPLNYNFSTFIKSDFKGMSKLEVLRKWEKIVRRDFPLPLENALDSFTSKRISSRACEHMFCYMFYSRWVENNLDIASTSERKDFEMELLNLVSLNDRHPAESASEEDDSEIDFRSSSGFDFHGEVSGIGCSSQNRPSQISHLLEREGDKLVGSATKVMKPDSPVDCVKSDSTVTSSVTQSIVSKISNASLKSVGNSFRSTPSRDDNESEDISKFISSKPVYQSYQHMINWLKDSHKEDAKEYQHIESPMMYIKLIIQTVVNTGKQNLEMKEEFRKFLFKPTELFSSWAEVLENNARTPCFISFDAIIKIMFRYCWENLKDKSRITKETDASDLIQLWMNLPYTTKEGLYNVRGVIIHLLNDDFGIIQTKYGKVLYERNVCFNSYRNGVKNSLEKMQDSKSKTFRGLFD